MEIEKFLSSPGSLADHVAKAKNQTHAAIKKIQDPELLQKQQMMI
jgi:hypothetical protein